MLCSSQNKQFIDKILSMKARDIKGLLKDEDQKYIIRKQRQITQNMPQHLKPNQNIQTKATGILKNLLQVHHVNQKQAAEAKLAQFPSTFSEKTKSHHWNLENKANKQEKLGVFGSKGFGGTSNSKGFMQNLMSDFEGFKSGLEGEANLWKGERLPEVKVGMGLGEREEREEGEREREIKGESFIRAEDLGYNERQLEKQSLLRDPESKPYKSAQQAHQQADNQSSITFTHPQQNHSQQPPTIPNPFTPPLIQQQKHSPFISNKMNFLDQHTNKKPVNQNYLTPETYSMNMLQYAHNQKRENTFGDGYSYPNVIMGGSGVGWMKTAQVMRDNPFRKTFVVGGRVEGGEGLRSQGDERSGMNVQRSGAQMESEMNFRENVQEVLKYTLGDKRYTTSIIGGQHKQLATSINIKSNAMESSFQKQLPVKKQRVLENPFVRRPASSYKY